MGTLEYMHEDSNAPLKNDENDSTETIGGSNGTLGPDVNQPLHFLFRNGNQVPPRCKPKKVQDVLPEAGKMRKNLPTSLD